MMSVKVKGNSIEHHILQKARTHISMIENLYKPQIQQNFSPKNINSQAFEMMLSSSFSRSA